MAMVESLAVGPTLASGAMRALLKAWSSGAFRSMLHVDKERR
jgi:hypothetical protein